MSHPITSASQTHRLVLISRSHSFYPHCHHLSAYASQPTSDIALSTLIKGAMEDDEGYNSSLSLRPPTWTRSQQPGGSCETRAKSMHISWVPMLFPSWPSATAKPKVAGLAALQKPRQQLPQATGHGTARSSSGRNGHGSRQQQRGGSGLTHLSGLVPCNTCPLDDDLEDERKAPLRPLAAPRGNSSTRCSFTTDLNRSGERSGRGGGRNAEGVGHAAVRTPASHQYGQQLTPQKEGKVDPVSVKNY